MSVVASSEARHVTDDQWLAAIADVGGDNSTALWMPDRPGAPLRVIRRAYVVTIRADGSSFGTPTGHRFGRTVERAFELARTRAVVVAWEDPHTGVAHYFAQGEGGVRVRGHVDPFVIRSGQDTEALSERLAREVDRQRGIHRGANASA